MFKKTRCLLAAVTSAIVLSLAVAGPVAAQTGFAQSYSWQYDCDDWGDVSQVTFISSASAENEATDTVLESCGILVTVYSGANYNGWDFESEPLSAAIEDASVFDVPIFFMMVDNAYFTADDASKTANISAAVAYADSVVGDLSKLRVE